MALLKTFEIDIVGPQETFVYELDDTFFALFEESLLQQGKLQVTAKLHKTHSQVHLQLHIVGEVALVCDRSLEPFNHPIALDREVLFKRGDAYAEIDENVYTIAQHSTTLDIAQHCYDFISLAVPVKKLHPRFQSE